MNFTSCIAIRFTLQHIHHFLIIYISPLMILCIFCSVRRTSFPMMPGKGWSYSNLFVYCSWSPWCRGTFRTLPRSSHPLCWSWEPTVSPQTLPSWTSGGALLQTMAPPGQQNKSVVHNQYAYEDLYWWLEILPLYSDWRCIHAGLKGFCLDCWTSKSWLWIRPFTAYYADPLINF